VRVSLFGGLRVVVDGRTLGPADFGGVKPKEILEILLLARGRPVTKQALADALWPADAPQNVTSTVETYVSTLRRKLFTDRDVAREVLITGNGSYRLSSEHVSVDIDEFDQLMMRADRFGADRLELLISAAALATGDLLEDEPSAHWVESDREIYRDRATRVALLLASHYVMAGEYVRTIRYAERALAIRPFSEEALRLVMLGNHGLGQDALARQSYDRFCAALGTELGLDCSTETADLAGIIGAGATIQELLNDRGEPVPAIARQLPDPQDRRKPERKLPFIGRRAELDRARSVIHKSRERRFSLVLVHGLAGMGRSAFLDQLQAGLPVASGLYRYSPLEQEAPKLPLAGVICNALQDLPEFANARRYASSALLNGSERAFSMLAHLIHIDAPIVLLLDDFQWADPDTVATIARLMHELPGLPVTIVATVRESKLAHNNPVRILEPTDTIRLRGLESHECDDAVDISRSLLLATGGSPALMADQYRWQRAGYSGPSPSLAEAVLCAARGLGGIYPELLQAAAVIPSPFFVEDLAFGHQSLNGPSLSYLKTLCDLELLESVGDRFRFRSSLVRQVIAESCAEEADTSWRRYTARTASA